MRDLRSGIPGAEKDGRVLENLVNGCNLTTLDKNMWLTSFSKGEKITISLEFPSNLAISGRRLLKTRFSMISESAAAV